MGEEEKKDQNEGEEEKTLEEEIADIDFDDTDELMDSDESSETEGGTEDEKGASDDTSSDDKKDEKEDKKEEGTKEDSKTSEEEKETKTEEEKETEKEKEGDPKDHQITKLMQEIERLSGLSKAEPEPEPTDEKKSGDADDKDEKKPDETSIHDFIGEIDMDDVSADPAVFNKILHKVIAKVQQQTAEQVLKSIPQVVMSQVQQQTYFKTMADNFYKDNADLINVKQVVRACAQQIQQTNPEWDVEKVFKETAVKTRQTLGMSAVKINSDENIPSAEDAAFAKQKGGSKSNLKPQRSSLQMEIDEL